MNRGALYAEEHDLILRKLPKTTGHPLSHWRTLLDTSGVGAQGYLAALEWLRDERKVPHHPASAIVWAYLNPTMIPADLEEPGGDAEATAEQASAVEAGPAPRAAKRKAAKPSKASQEPAAAPAEEPEPASDLQSRSITTTHVSTSSTSIRTERQSGVARSRKPAKAKASSSKKRPKAMKKAVAKPAPRRGATSGKPRQKPKTSAKAPAASKKRAPKK